VGSHAYATGWSPTAPLGDETLEIGAPINFAGASLEELRDKEDLPGDFVRR